MWDAVKFGEASRSLGRHKAAHRQTITHRLRRRRLQRDGPQRKPFSGGFVVAAAEKEEEEEGEVFIASSSLLRSRQFAPAKRGGELRRTGRRGGRDKKRKIATRASSLPLCSRERRGGDLSRALHTSVIPSNRVSSSSVVVANFCTPSAHRRPTAGRTRYIVPAEAKTQRAPALRSTEGGGGELKTGSREGEGQKSEVISLPR